MKRTSKVVYWVIGILLGGILLYIGILLLLGTLTEFRPAPQVVLAVNGRAQSSSDTTTRFSVMIWNIGYGGLDREMDFFYDGGKRVRPDRISFLHSWSGILRFLQEHDSIDFILLQEVDTQSRRSYYTDEVSAIGDSLTGFCTSYAVNYDCRFVPVPSTRPMGRVTSGMVTCSRYQPVSATRFGFDNRVSWPNRLFYLKRCFLVTRFPVGAGKELVLVNIHNSAFDTGGVMRQREMEVIRHFMKGEYARGNYLVAGGDWNANPPGFDPEAIATGDRTKRDEFTDLAGYFPDWAFAYDPTAPTNRNVDQPYRKGITPVTILDFFLVSPNVRVLQVHTFPTAFAESDHQPVLLQFALDSSR